MSYTLHHGLPEAQRSGAAALYWQAFGGKLGLVMGPKSRALPYLESIIRLDHCIAALGPDGALLGLIGYQGPEGSFAANSLPALRRSFGISAYWRAALMQLLGHDIDNDNFLIDGFSVAPQARSRGIGAALIAALADLAHARGYNALRLDVIDSNWRAIALYRRLGFAPTKTTYIGLLRFAFGFRAAVTMVKQL